MDLQCMFLLFMVVFLLGYGVGRRIGLKEGRKEGLTLSPLELRRQSLERGRCVICDMFKEESVEKLNKENNYDKIKKKPGEEG